MAEHYAVAATTVEIHSQLSASEHCMCSRHNKGTDSSQAKSRIYQQPVQQVDQPSTPVLNAATPVCHDKPIQSGCMVRVTALLATHLWPYYVIRCHVTCYNSTSIVGHGNDVVAVPGACDCLFLWDSPHDSDLLTLQSSNLVAVTHISTLGIIDENVRYG